MFHQWFSLNEIVESLQITELPDKKYLGLKLKELNRKEKIVYIFHVNDIYWRKNKTEFEDKEFASFNLYTDFYREFLDNNPEDLKAWRELGYWYGSVQQFNKAIRCFEAIIDLDPTDAEIWRLLGDSYDMMMELESSILCYKNALRFVDIDIDFDLYLIILLDLGNVYYSLENYKKALRAFKILFEFKEELNDADIGYLDSLIKHIEEDEGVSLEEAHSPDSILQEIKQLKLLFEDQIKLSADRNIILTKSYIDNLLKPYFEKPSKKIVKKLENMINTFKIGWPEDMWNLFVKEYTSSIEQKKKLQPAVWKKWGNILMKLISVI